MGALSWRQLSAIFISIIAPSTTCLSGYKLTKLAQMKRRILADGISLAEIATTIGSELTAADGRAIVGLCPVDQGEDGCIAFSAETSTRRLLETLKDSPIAAL